MDLTSQNKTYYNRSLEEVLLKFYSAAALSEIYLALLAPMLPPEGPNVKLNKATLVSRFQQFLSNKPGIQRLLSALPTPLHEAISILIWEGSLSLANLEARLGSTISKLRPESELRSYDSVPFKASGAMELLVLRPESSYRSFYRSKSPDKADVAVLLPPAFVSLFRKHFPKPPFYDWQPLPAPPADTFGFDGSLHIAGDLSVIADFLHRGSLKRTVSGKLPKATLRAVADLTSGTDFVDANQQCKPLELLRHQLLIDCIDFLPDAFTAQLRKHPFPAKQVFTALLKHLSPIANTLVDSLLPHLKLRSSFHEFEMKPEPLEALLKLFATLPTNAWIGADNVRKFVDLREIPVVFFNHSAYRFKVADSSPSRVYSYSGPEDVSPYNFDDAVLTPTLYGFAFLLAAFGLLEIRFIAPPVHPRLHVGSNEWVSPWDGLRAVRLTELGAFAFGLTSTLNIALPAKRESRIRFHGPRMLAFSSSNDPVTLQALDEFLDKAGPGVYRFSKQKLFKGCFEKKDLLARIDDFRTRMDAELPPEWEAALSVIADAPAPLERQSGFTLYRIADDPALRQLFASDPLLRKSCLRAEGWCVAIKSDAIKSVREHLRALGFFLEGDISQGPTAAKPAKKKKKARKSRWW